MNISATILLSEDEVEELYRAGEARLDEDLSPDPDSLRAAMRKLDAERERFSDDRLREMTT